MIGVVERALHNIFEPMTQTERLACINYLRTQFESDAPDSEATPKSVVAAPVTTSKSRGLRRGGLPFYIKSITGIDTSKSGGYAILGDFVQPSRLGDLADGTRILIGTKASPKKYVLAKVKGGSGLTFGDADGREITVLGADLILMSSDVKDIIEALER